MKGKEAGKIFLSDDLSLSMAKERRTNVIGTSRNIPRKVGQKNSATSHTSVAEAPHPTKQAKLACKLEGRNIQITIVIPPMKGKNDDNETAACV